MKKFIGDYRDPQNTGLFDMEAYFASSLVQNLLADVSAQKSVASAA